MASLVALIATSRVGLIHSQQHREGEFGTSESDTDAGLATQRLVGTPDEQAP